MEFHFIPINLDLGFYVSTAYFSIRFLRTDFKIKESTFSISYCNDTDFGISAGAEIFIGARTREKGTAIRLLITQYCSCILFWLCNL